MLTPYTSIDDTDCRDGSSVSVILVRQHVAVWGGTLLRSYSPPDLLRESRQTSTLPLPLRMHTTRTTDRPFLRAEKPLSHTLTHHINRTCQKLSKTRNISLPTLATSPPIVERGSELMDLALHMLDDQLVPQHPALHPSSSIVTLSIWLSALQR